MDVNVIYLCAVCLFILCDIVTGLVAAIKAGDFSSSKMREGFYHKFAILALIGVAYSVDWCSGYFELPGVVELIYPATCLYIVLMELGSVLENICKLNPALDGAGIMAIFRKGRNDA